MDQLSKFVLLNTYDMQCGRIACMSICHKCWAGYNYKKEPSVTLAGLAILTKGRSVTVVGLAIITKGPSVTVAGLAIVTK
jgi:hypothetical protein